MLKPGDSFDRYTLEEILGEGGMGVVYRALDEKLGRRVALKVVRPVGSAELSDENTRRLLREARSAAALDHPGAVAIYDVGEVAGAPFIAMELVAGRTLRAQMSDAPKPSIEQRLRWLVEIARALEAAHRKGLVHLDIKPENVMVRADDGAIKVLDFGIARRMDTEVDPAGPTEARPVTVTREGVSVGTPLYMAPEQLKGSPLDGRADQFAWAVVAHELFAGRVPWQADGDVLRLAASILTDAPPPLAPLCPELPQGLEAVLGRALAKAPADRFATMSELLDAIEPLLDAKSDRGPRRPASRAPAPPSGDRGSVPALSREDFRRYSRDEIQEILQRALEREHLAGGGEGFHHDELLEAAREVGIDPDQLERAAAEVARRQHKQAQKALERPRAMRSLLRNAATFAVVNLFLLLLVGGRVSRFVFLGWGLGLSLQAIRFAFPREPRRRERPRPLVREQAVEAGVGQLLRATTARLRIAPPAAPRVRVGEPPAARVDTDELALDQASLEAARPSTPAERAARQRLSRQPALAAAGQGWRRSLRRGACCHSARSAQRGSAQNNPRKPPLHGRVRARREPGTRGA